jgi:hypothetical protein
VGTAPYALLEISMLLQTRSPSGFSTCFFGQSLRWHYLELWDSRRQWVTTASMISVPDYLRHRFMDIKHGCIDTACKIRRDIWARCAIWKPTFGARV